MKLTTKHLARRWYEALQQAKSSAWPSISESMLKQIQRAGRKRDLPAIVRALAKLEQAEQKVLDVVVTTSSSREVQEEAQLLSQLFGDRDIAVTRRIDPSLLGGVVVETHNDRWDFSVRHQLRRLTRDIND
jgi:F0F1-type ATP synthase delta subunit